MPDLRIALLRRQARAANLSQILPREPAKGDAAPERHTGAGDRVRSCGALRRRSDLSSGTEVHVGSRTPNPVAPYLPSRTEQVGACLLIVAVLFTAITELPLAWVAQLLEALR
jgi:hypothetical protein